MMRLAASVALAICGCADARVLVAADVSLAQGIRELRTAVAPLPAASACVQRGSSCSASPAAAAAAMGAAAVLLLAAFRTQEARTVVAPLVAAASKELFAPSERPANCAVFHRRASTKHCPSIHVGATPAWIAARRQSEPVRQI